MNRIKYFYYLFWHKIWCFSDRQKRSVSINQNAVCPKCNSEAHRELVSLRAKVVMQKCELKRLNRQWIDLRKD